MNLQNMQYLIEISDCGSLSAAAKRLSVTQPYLSKVLRETEHEYGITIFTRGKGGIVPTESGRLFLDMSRDLLDHAGHFRQTFRNPSGFCRLRISANSFSPANDALIRMANSCSDSSFRFFCREMSNTDVIQDLASGHADIGCILYPESGSEPMRDLLASHSLEEHLLFRTPVQFFCRADHPVLHEFETMTPEILYAYGLVLCPGGQAHLSAAESIYRDDLFSFLDLEHVSRILYAGSRALFCDMIRQTDFLGVTAAPLCAEDRGLVTFPVPERLLPESGPCQAVCSYLVKKGAQLPAAARTYLDVLEQCSKDGSETR